MNAAALPCIRVSTFSAFADLGELVHAVEAHKYRPTIRADELSGEAREAALATRAFLSARYGADAVYPSEPAPVSAPATVRVDLTPTQMSIASEEILVLRDEVEPIEVAREGKTFFEFPRASAEHLRDRVGFLIEQHLQFPVAGDVAETEETALFANRSRLRSLYLLLAQIERALGDNRAYQRAKTEATRAFRHVW